MALSVGILNRVVISSRPLGMVCFRELMACCVASGTFPGPGPRSSRPGSGGGRRPRRPGPERGAHIGEQSLETPGLGVGEQVGLGA